MSKTTWQDSSIIHSPFPGNGNIRWSPSYLRMSRLDSSAAQVASWRRSRSKTSMSQASGFMKGIVMDVSWWIQISSESIKFNLGISLYPCFPSKYFLVTNFCCRGFDFDAGRGTVWNRAVGTVTITISRSWLNLRRTKFRVTWCGCEFLGVGNGWWLEEE